MITQYTDELLKLTSDLTEKQAEDFVSRALQAAKQAGWDMAANRYAPETNEREERILLLEQALRTEGWGDTRIASLS